MCPLGFSPRFSQGENICSGPQRTALPHSQLYDRQEKAVESFKKIISICKNTLGYLGEVFQENCYYKTITRFSSPGSPSTLRHGYFRCSSDTHSLIRSSTFSKHAWQPWAVPCSHVGCCPGGTRASWKARCIPACVHRGGGALGLPLPQERRSCFLCFALFPICKHSSQISIILV